MASLKYSYVRSNTFVSLGVETVNADWNTNTVIVEVTC